MSGTVEVGQYVDGWWGIYTSARAYEVVRSWGWEPSDAETLDAIAGHALAASSGALAGWDDADALARSAYECDALEALNEALDEGEEWAMGVVVPVGHYIGSHEAGGWGIWEDENE